MATEGSPRQHILDSLKALHADLFPKICGQCGAVFHSSDDYQRKTRRFLTPLRPPSRPSEDLNFVRLYRHCRCGSTLLMQVCDRRDDTEPGRRRREKFQRALDLLVASGWDRNIAREEIQNLLLGEKSSLLEIFLTRGNH
ncbi:hypothetical protein [Geoalkalibacter sp.]|uniref:hypothetical protein n=1 Tax=Geoalkalibacter sp. TaxID=3041440 RepID=UPI00272E367B|nr:hypothetical protein [Geoalkalibacter sp.]